MCQMVLCNELLWNVLVHRLKLVYASEKSNSIDHTNKLCIQWFKSQIFMQCTGTARIHFLLPAFRMYNLQRNMVLQQI